MRKLRIAQVYNLSESIPPLNKNGLEQVVYYLTEELVRLGHDVTLFTTADSKTSAKQISMWPEALTRSPYRNALYPGTLDLLTVSEVIRRREEFDIIHGHLRMQLSVFAPYINTPLVTTVHHPISQESLENLPENYQHPYKDLWNERKKHINTVVVSNFQAKKYDLPSTVIHNGLPVETWPFEQNPQDYFAFLGYITPDKGVAQAIQAILPTDQKLLIAGPINKEDVANQQFFKASVEPFLSEKIKYLGPLNYDQKTDFLKKAKATLMPIQWDEPFGMVAIESMASGTPVIAWNRAAMPEIIEDGISGFLVGSVEEMSQKIAEVDTLSRSQARNRVESKFSSSVMAKNYVSLYEQILNQKK